MSRSMWPVLRVYIYNYIYIYNHIYVCIYKGCIHVNTHLVYAMVICMV